MDFSSFKPLKLYERYGGLSQGHELTADEIKYDETCRAIDDLERQLSEKRLSLFTAGEFMWFSNFANKMHVFPNQDRLDKQLNTLTAMMTAISTRE